MPQPAPHGTDQISTGHHEQSQLGNTQFFQLWDATFYPCGVTAFKCSWKQYSQHSDRTKGREDRSMDWLQNGQAGLNPGLHTLSKFL